MREWVRIADLPQQEVVIGKLPPTTNHGYQIFAREVNGKVIARMSKTSAAKKWTEYAEACLDSVDLTLYEGRILVLIAEYVKDFRSDTDGYVKFILDSLQKKAFKNDSQVDCLIPHRIRVKSEEECVLVTIISLGDYEITGWDFSDVKVRGVKWKKARKPEKYNNESHRRGS